MDPAGDPSSLPINVTVGEILEAARASARTGRAVKIDPAISVTRSSSPSRDRHLHDAIAISMTRSSP